MATQTFLHVGGLVAIGFDSTGDYLLVVSHSGRGVFAVGSWVRVARDNGLAYPSHGTAVGIGPIANAKVPVVERYDPVRSVSIRSPDGRYALVAESDGVTIREVSA